MWQGWLGRHSQEDCRGNEKKNFLFKLDFETQKVHVAAVRQRKVNRLLVSKNASTSTTYTVYLNRLQFNVQVFIRQKEWHSARRHNNAISKSIYPNPYKIQIEKKNKRESIRARGKQKIEMRKKKFYKALSGNH